MFDCYGLINHFIACMLYICKILMNIFNKTFSCQGKKKLAIRHSSKWKTWMEAFFLFKKKSSYLFPKTLESWHWVTVIHVSLELDILVLCFCQKKKKKVDTFCKVCTSVMHLLIQNNFVDVLT